jgi:hypothetical protein
MKNLTRAWLLVGAVISGAALIGLGCVLFAGRITSLLTVNQNEAHIKTIQIAGIALLISSMVMFFTRQQTHRYINIVGLRFANDRHVLTQDIDRYLRAESRVTWVLLGGITLLGALLQIAYLSQPIRNDEALTVFDFASRPLLQAITRYNEPNNHLLNTLGHCRQKKCPISGKMG